MASVAHWSLDVAADSQEELQDWVKKIREVAQTADARVRGVCGGRRGARWQPVSLLGARPVAPSPLVGREPRETRGASPVGLPGGHLHIQGQRPQKSWAGSRRNEWCGVGRGLHFEGVGGRGRSQEGQAREARSSQGWMGSDALRAVEVLTGTVRT